MKIINKQLINSILFCLLLSTLSACAKDTTAKNLLTKDLNLIDFQHLRKAQAVTFVLVPWNDFSYTKFKQLPRWDESMLKEVGCTYTTQDIKMIVSLVDALENNDIQKSSVNEALFIPVKGESIMSGIRNGIYLTFSDGTEVKFLFESALNYNYSVKRVLGQLTEQPKVKNLSLSANRLLTRSLAQWAVKIGRPIAADDYVKYWCERDITNRSSHE